MSLTLKLLRDWGKPNELPVKRNTSRSQSHKLRGEFNEKLAAGEKLKRTERNQIKALIFGCAVQGGRESAPIAHDTFVKVIGKRSKDLFNQLYYPVTQGYKINESKKKVTEYDFNEHLNELVDFLKSKGYATFLSFVKLVWQLIDELKQFFSAGFSFMWLLKKFMIVECYKEMFNLTDSSNNKNDSPLRFRSEELAKSTGTRPIVRLPLFARKFIQATKRKYKKRVRGDGPATHGLLADAPAASGMQVAV
jgi:hypothetical protein